MSGELFRDPFCASVRRPALHPVQVHPVLAADVGGGLRAGACLVRSTWTPSNSFSARRRPSVLAGQLCPDAPPAGAACPGSSTSASTLRRTEPRDASRARRGRRRRSAGTSRSAARSAGAFSCSAFPWCLTCCPPSSAGSRANASSSRAPRCETLTPAASNSSRNSPPTPTPSASRPGASWSIVISCLAVHAGWRAPSSITANPSVTRSVTAAQAAIERDRVEARRRALEVVTCPDPVEPELLRPAGLRPTAATARQRASGRTSAAARRCESSPERYCRTACCVCPATISTSSAREWMSSFMYTWRRWYSIVFGLRNSDSAASRVVRPERAASRSAAPAPSTPRSCSARLGAAVRRSPPARPGPDRPRAARRGDRTTARPRGAAHGRGRGRATAGAARHMPAECGPFRRCRASTHGGRAPARNPRRTCRRSPSAPGTGGRGRATRAGPWRSPPRR